MSMFRWSRFVIDSFEATEPGVKGINGQISRGKKTKMMRRELEGFYLGLLEGGLPKVQPVVGLLA